MPANERRFTSRNRMYARELRVVPQELQNLFGIYDGAQLYAGCSSEAESSKTGLGYIKPDYSIRLF